MESDEDIRGLPLFSDDHRYPSGGDHLWEKFGEQEGWKGTLPVPQLARLAVVRAAEMMLADPLAPPVEVEPSVLLDLVAGKRGSPTKKRCVSDPALRELA